MGTLAASITGLTKRYGSAVALEDVDLSLREGEIRGLLGPNGAGKTTLLRILFGLIHADEGSIELLGHPLTRIRREPSQGVAGFVEEPAFYPYLSARANLELLVDLDDGDPGEIVPALERVGLLERAADRVGTFSTGMRQRLGIAAALLRAPRLLLLDEPTSGLDPAGTRAVADLLRDLSQQGVAVLVSSHLIGELEVLCHSHTIIRSGRVVWEGDARRLEREATGSLYSLSTGDDEGARELARHLAGIRTQTAAGGLHLHAEAAALDEFVIGLGRRGIPVRRLELLASPLERLFFALTVDGGGAR